MKRMGQVKLVNQEACGRSRVARTAVNTQRVRRTRKLQLEETTFLIFASRLLIE